MSDRSWRDIAATVCRRIESGTYPVGSRVPTYRQLAAEQEVSLTPVRAAYGWLQRAGVLEGRQGVGVFVQRQPVPGALPEPSTADRVIALERDLRAQIATLREAFETHLQSRHHH